MTGPAFTLAERSDTGRVRSAAWMLVLVLIANGCDRFVGAQSWHDSRGWKAADYFTDVKVVELCDAIAANDIDDIRKLLAAGADVNARGKGNMTPLLWAFPDEKLERFQLLLEAGADPNVYTKSDFGDPRAFQPGDTVTHMASRSAFGHFWPVFEHGGDPNLPSKLRGFAGMTPVYFVITSGAADKKERITRLAELGGSLNRPESVFSSPLMTAHSYFGRHDLCLLLLDLGADPTAYEGDGVSRLTHNLCGALGQKRRGFGQLHNAPPERMKAFEDLVERLEGMGLSMAEAQADLERWAQTSDLAERRKMRQREREERERKKQESAAKRTATEGDSDAQTQPDERDGRREAARKR